MPSDLISLPTRRPTARGDRPCRVVEWKPWPLPNPSLAGHASFEFAGGWQVNQCPVFRSRDGTVSVGTPSIPLLDAEGRARLGADGKRMYAAVLTFATAAGRERWRSVTAAALAEAGIVP